jgi:Flp pilus assembly protein TadD
MSGFNKRSRLAPQGSGKGPKDGASDKPAKPPASTAKSGATAKKLQWSIGDLLNKLENPETELPAAKAALEVPKAPDARTGSQPASSQQTPLAKEKKPTEERSTSKTSAPAKVPPVKSDTAKQQQDADKRKNTSEKASTKSGPEASTPWSEPALEPGWDLPTPAASDSWTLPTSDKDSEWSAMSGETVGSAPQTAEKKELWGAAAESNSWGMPQTGGPSWAAPAKDAAAQELWAMPATDSADSWATQSSDSASPELWAASGVAEPEREVWGAANLAEEETKLSEIKSSFASADVEQAPSAKPSSWEEPSTAQSAITDRIDQTPADEPPVDQAPSPDWETPGEAPSWERAQTIEEPELWGEPSVVPDLSQETSATSETTGAEPKEPSMSKEIEAREGSTAVAPDKLQETPPRKPTSELGNTASMLLKKAAEKKNALFSSETRMKELEPAVAAEAATAGEAEPPISSETAATAIEPQQTSFDHAPADIEPPRAATEVEANDTHSERASSERAAFDQVKDSPDADDSAKLSSDSKYTYASTGDSAETGMFSIAPPELPAPKKDRSFQSRLENAALSKFTTGRAREKDGATADDTVSDTAAAPGSSRDSASAAAAETPAPRSSVSPITSHSGLAAQPPDAEKPSYAMGDKFGIADKELSDSSNIQSHLDSRSASAPVSAGIGESTAGVQEATDSVEPSTSATRLPQQDQIAAQDAVIDVSPDLVRQSDGLSLADDQPASQSQTTSSSPPSQFPKTSSSETGKFMQSDLLGLITPEKVKERPLPPKSDIAKAKLPMPVPPVTVDRSKRPTMGEKAPALPTRDQSPPRSAKTPTKGLRSLESMQSKRNQRALLVASSALLIVAMAWFTWSFEQKRNLDTKVQTQFAGRQYNDALATTEKALISYPNEARFHFYKGRILRMRGDSAKALQSLNTADANEPNNPEILKERGLLYCSIGQFPQSIADFNQAIGDGRQATADAYADRGRTELKTGAFVQALADFERAGKLHPKEAQYAYGRADAYSGMQQYSDAVKTLSAILAKQPHDVHALAMRALAQYRTKNTVAALADIDKAVAIEPSASVYFYRGLIRAEQRRFAPAITDFSQALKYDPSNTAIIEARAQAYSDSSDLNKALTHYNALSNLQGGQDSPAFHERRAAAVFSAGKHKETLDDYAKLLVAKPDDVQIRLKHAAICEAQQEYTQAYDDYEFLLMKDPKNVDYLLKRGWVSAKREALQHRRR